MIQQRHKADSKLQLANRRHFRAAGPLRITDGCIFCFNADAMAVHGQFDRAAEFYRAAGLLAESACDLIAVFIYIEGCNERGDRANQDKDDHQKTGEEFACLTHCFSPWDQASEKS